MNTGLLCAIGCFVIWGMFPLYWKQLDDVPALQLALHRIVWSFVLLVIILTVFRQWTELYQGMTWRIIGVYTLSTCCIFTNWYILVWAINAGYILETSLGNFINPLISVGFGVAIFMEKLHMWQWVSIALAAGGVLIVAIAYDKFPWIALTGAFTFALYGLLKKWAPLRPIHGLFLETAILLPASMTYLVFAQAHGTGVFLRVSPLHDVLIVGGGIVTVVPLFLFSYAARRVPMSLLGVLAYIAPSVRFIIGSLVYHEALSTFQLSGFILVWVALVIFTVQGLAASRQESLTTDDTEATRVFALMLTPAKGDDVELQDAYDRA
ncbi:membrane protein [Achlya hypogyna]|uniref:Membrane protein n=1 Tax=Achlya hypogyna TaxID=1202772 RepID=A0A1V9YGP4_ACHHY|nr:membrane protein [Achlya hypogyna]